MRNIFFDVIFLYGICVLIPIFCVLAGELQKQIAAIANNVAQNLDQCEFDLTNHLSNLKTIDGNVLLH